MDSVPKRSVDHIWGEPLKIKVNEQELVFDLIRVQDIAAFAEKIHERQRQAVADNIDKIAPTPEERLKIVTTVYGGNSVNIFENLSTFEGICFLMDRAYSRCNDGRYIIGQLPMETVYEVFNQLAAASGLRDPNPTKKTEEKN